MSAAAAPDTPSLDLDALLQKHFGFATFRPGQREALEALLSSGSLLCIQPTGYGKSLLYQLPAAGLPGLTVVISPLLALMRDQLAQLNSRFQIPAGSFNSDQSDEENAAVRRAAIARELKLLFISPEQLDRLDRAELIASLPLSLLVIDEAHCISTWGHDFRPAYRQIAPVLRAAISRHPGVRVLALTATANARTEADIRSQLEAVGNGPIAVHRRNMDRPNLALAVHAVPSFEHKLAWLARHLPHLPSPGLLYCATRDNTEVVAAYLQSVGLNIPAYHAGLPPDRKRALQEAFLRGDFQAIAATNALGMGIDKSDLRYVIHVDIPGSITAYYQEVGRAGRDGQPARGILLFDRDDLRIQNYFIQSAQPTAQDFQTVLHIVRARAEAAEPASAGALRAASGLHPTRVTVVLAELTEQGFIVKRLDGRRQVYAPAPDTQDTTPDLTRYTRQDHVRRAELAAITRYAESQSGCAMQILRLALGDADAAPCGRCAHCAGDILPDLGGALQASPQPDGALKHWMNARPVVVSGYRKVLSPGLAVLDSQRRTHAFVQFMQQRASSSHPTLGPELSERLDHVARQLAAGLANPPAAIIPLPSQTWAQRQAVAQRLAELLTIPCLLNALTWTEQPTTRQGELLNNDQRRDSVNGHMTWVGDPPAPGTIILLDDYVGSGASLREAARVLRRQLKLTAPIVPLTVARVRWRLGRPGIV